LYQCSRSGKVCIPSDDILFISYNLKNESIEDMICHFENFQIINENEYLVSVMDCGGCMFDEPAVFL